MLTFRLLGPLAFLAFLCLFFYFYKTSGKFRPSVIGAIAAIIVFFSGLKPVNSGGADAFQSQNQQQQNRPLEREGLFGRNSNKGGSGPGRSNNNGSSGDGSGLPNDPMLKIFYMIWNKVPV